MLAKNSTKNFVKGEMNELDKKVTTTTGSGIILTSNEIKDIIKVIKSL